ncbi:MAG: FAD:protein FMN transferase [Candidatus Omnitrophica bacterium]|nr:FAD:protein FMN transferase [Candidatus Omnitrophota bacterium]
MNSFSKNISLVVIILVCVAGCGRHDTHTFRQTHMGTYADITIRQEDFAQPHVTEAVNEAFREIERIDHLMSSFRADSVISRINRTPRETPVQLSPDVLAVFREAIRLYSLTKGAFDITVGPLVRQWGFYSQEIVHSLPHAEEIQKALEVVGTKYLVLQPETESFYLEKDGMEIDVAGLAKGYAVDRAIEAIRAHGVRSALVNCGGDIYCLGAKSEQDPWKVGIRHPRNQKKVIGLLRLVDTAVATSGDYENFVTFGGERYSHIIDPRTGRPSSSRVIGVTVIAPQCVTADGLATALFVMGADEGMRLIETLPYIECIIISEQKGSDELEIAISSGIGDRVTILR